MNQCFAQKTQTKSASAQLTRIANICLQSPVDCLVHVDKALLSTPKKSRIYFEILQYKFESLFNLQKNDELYLATKPWVNEPNLPIHFTVTNAIYFAKSAWHIGEKSAAKHSYHIAKNLLGKVNEEYPSPIRLVQFANLQMQLKEHQQAYNLMSALAHKYPNSPDTRFMTELHGNLGHAANQLGKTELALTHWQETKKWVYLFGNKQQIAVVLFNLADIYDQLEHYPAAEKSFKEAMAFSQKAGDKMKENQSRYRLLSTRLKQTQVCDNSLLFTTIEAQFLPNKPTYNLEKIKQELTVC
ncbi:tetratricopeptide repeat protein [Colwelliaceae bacterium 6441]